MLQTYPQTSSSTRSREADLIEATRPDEFKREQISIGRRYGARGGTSYKVSSQATVVQCMSRANV